MKKLLVILLLLSPMIVFSQTTWKVVSYEVSFKIKNAGLNVNGKFTGLNADLKFSPDKLATSHLKASVEANSIKTGINKRDEDLQDEKYFNAEKYKLIEVASTKLYIKGAQYAGMFNITMKGVTLPVEIPFEFNQIGDEGEFKGTFTVNRRDYGVGNKTLTMSNEATVEVSIKVKK